MKYHHISVTINTPQQPSFFMGSALRGAFGYALKRVTCINPSYKCEGCFATHSCLYHDFYEAQNGYHSYRFDVGLGADSFDFALYLFEGSCEKLPYILSALHRMLTEIGLTGDSIKFDDFRIEVNGGLVYDGEEFDMSAVVAQEWELLSPLCDVTLRLLTPLRIKKENRFLRDDVALEDILRSIHQRERELCYGENYAKLGFVPSYKLLSKSLRHQTLIRKSSRQKSKMNMDGVVGELLFTNLDPQSYRLLKLGELLAVGKQTVMGLGSIRVT